MTRTGWVMLALTAGLLISETFFVGDIFSAQLDAETFNIGETPIGKSVPLVFKLNNLGKVPVRLSKLLWEGPDAKDFKLDADSECRAGAIIKARGSCTVKAHFTRSAWRAERAHLQYEGDEVRPSKHETGL